MIVDYGKHYVYKHIRVDKDEIFYIGIRTKTLYGKHRTTYRRAFSKLGRNKIWKDIVKKTEYQTEIILESDDYKFIKEKEVEFIKLYGRINLGTGILANLTDGGDGQIGTKISEETRQKLVTSHLGHTHTKESREKIGKVTKERQVYKLAVEARRIPVLQLDLDGKLIDFYKSASEAARLFKRKPCSIYNACSGRQKTAFGYKWEFCPNLK